MTRCLETSFRRFFSPILSDYLHVLQYFMPTHNRSHFNTSVVTFSIDVDVGDEKIGLVNEGKNDANVNSAMSEREIGRVERLALPSILELFDTFEIPVTFAIRGQALDIAPEIVDLITNCSVEHDIGGHGYYHRDIAEMTKQQAVNEFKLLAKAMSNINLRPKSFVFPRGRIGHLEVLSKFGYTSFRSSGGFPHDRMYVDRVGDLWRLYSTLMIHGGSRVRCINKILDICSQKGSYAHLWFHPWNFGSDEFTIQKGLKIVLKSSLAHIEALRRNGNITVYTMKDLVQLLERSRLSLPIYE